MVIGTTAYNLWQIASPDDTTDLPLFTTNGKMLTRAIYVGTTGDVVAVQSNNVPVKWTGVPAGTWLPIAVRRINATGTTALNLIAVYDN